VAHCQKDPSVKLPLVRLEGLRAAEREAHPAPFEAAPHNPEQSGFEVVRYCPDLAQKFRQEAAAAYP
jgi:hypothetical protein